jgi:hypothetical protein
MSPITHRQIRRWLYNPVYDANVKIKPIPIRNSFISSLFHSHKDVKNNNNTNDKNKNLGISQNENIVEKQKRLLELFKEKKD